VFIALVLFAPHGMVRILRDRLGMLLPRKKAQPTSGVTGKENTA